MHGQPGRETVDKGAICVSKEQFLWADRSSPGRYKAGDRAVKKFAVGESGPRY